MFINKTLENLELKLAQTREQNKEKFEKIDREFKKDFSNFLENIFPDDNLSVKRFVSAYFQLEKINNLDKNDSNILKNSLKKSLEDIPLKKEKKEKLLLKIESIEKNKDFFSEKMQKNLDITKNKNYPILQDLKSKDLLSETDLIDISIKFKETKNFLQSSKIIWKEKFELIKKNYFDLNDTKAETRINNFKKDFKDEINSSENLKIYPNVINLIWKNYTRLRLKNKTESKSERLRRMFKIAFLKLYRLKFSWIDINSILNKIESLDDLDSMISLLIKFFEQLKNNPVLTKDYVVLDEIEESENLVSEAENNKEKWLFADEKIIKAWKILEEVEDKLSKEDLEKILSDEVDLVWWNFVERNSWILKKEIEKKSEDDDLKKEDLEEIFEELKKEVFSLDEEKRKMFLIWDYDKIDELNDKLIEVTKKIEKIKKLLWVWDIDELEEEENVVLI